MREKPAIMDGTKLFSEKVSLVMPTLPPVSAIIEQIGESIQTRRISNFSRFSRELEESFANYLGVQHVLALSSGTSGLMLLERALDLSGEVIVPSFTFSATVHSLMWNRLTPAFVDIERDTFNLDPEAVEERITSSTSAILGVHIFGVPCRIAELADIAKQHNLKLIFDAAHACGSRYHDVYIGNFGLAEVFSSSPTKVLTTGEGGFLATNLDWLRDLVACGRNYGNTGDGDCQLWGLNAKMPEFSAILGLKSLEMLEESVQRRNEIAASFRSELGRLPGLAFQAVGPDVRSSVKDFAILVEEGEFGLNRDQLAQALAAENVETRPYFYPPAHRMKAYSAFYEQYKGSLPDTDYVAERVLCLPIYSHMTDELVWQICWAIERIQAYAEEIRARLSWSNSRRAA
jgi:dTDP-4-amino-4,6-dideoxygalactose transaminase